MLRGIHLNLRFALIILSILIVSLFSLSNNNLAEESTEGRMFYVKKFDAFRAADIKQRPYYFSKNMISSAIGRIANKKEDDRLLLSAKSVRNLINFTDNIKEITKYEFVSNGKNPKLIIYSVEYSGKTIIRTITYVNENNVWVINRLDTTL